MVYDGYYLQISGRDQLNKWLKEIGFYSFNHITRYKLWKKLGRFPPGLNINDRLSSIDDDERIFTKNLNDFLEEGNNFVELRPRTKLDVVELKVELEER